MQTYRDLLKDSKTSPWSGVLLKENTTEVQLAKQNIESLSLVDKVIWLNDFVPEQQEDKLFVIDEMNLLLGVLTSSEKSSVINNEERLKTINDLNSKLESIPTNELDNDLRLLKSNLDNLLLKFNANSNDDQFTKLEQQLLNSFSGRINSLSDALNAEEVKLGDIPLEVYERWVSNDYYKMQILPSHNLNDNAAMNDFVTELQSYDENVIGSPIISIEAGNSVITAFKSAFTYALIAIALLLLLLIRVKKDAANILLSVFIGGVFTFGFMLLFNIPLNFANIIGLPLLLGMGVDSGIHIADRFRQEHQSGINIFMTSSSRGVIVSSLTTIFSIGNLAFSSHQGTASMGLLLSVGLASMMVSTMIILPAFIVWQDSLTQQASDI